MTNPGIVILEYAHAIREEKSIDGNQWLFMYSADIMLLNLDQTN